jgi:hypothetical protein
VSDCEDVSITGCQVLGARARGILVRNSSVVRIADCTVRGAREAGAYRVAVEVDAASRHVLVAHNFLGRGGAGDLLLPEKAGTASGTARISNEKPRTGYASLMQPIRDKESFLIMIITLTQVPYASNEQLSVRRASL